MKITLNPHHESTVGNMVSWFRIAESVFRAAGEIRPDEKVTHFEVDEQGLRYFVERVKPATERP